MSSKHSLTTQRFTIEQLLESQKRTIQGLSKKTIEIDKIVEVNNLLGQVITQTKELNRVLSADNTSFSKEQNQKAEQKIKDIIKTFDFNLMNLLASHKKNCFDYVDKVALEDANNIQELYSFRLNIWVAIGGIAAGILIKTFIF